MKLNINLILIKIKSYIKNMMDDLVAVYFEKGIEPFKKPLIYSFGIILISYLIYFSNSSKVSSLREELNKMEIISRYYDGYTQSKDQLEKYLKILPSIKDKNEFLGYVLNNTASKYKISFSKIDPDREIKTNLTNLYFVSKQVQFSTDYNTLGNFIRDIENNKPFVYISNISIKKSDNQEYLGMLDVTLNVSTVFVAVK
jgi:Tfp pilus assembly protein PilO